MRAHSDSLQIYTDFTNIIYTQFNKYIKVFQSNGAGEYAKYSQITEYSSSAILSILMNKMVLLSKSIVTFLKPIEL